MLKFQIALTIILVGCISFLSCGRMQDKLDPVDPVTEEVPMDMTMDTMMDMIMDSTYASWASVALPAPTMTVAEAAEAMNPAGTGAAHNPGSDVFTPRTVYINDIGVMANKEGTMYPAGTMIFKEIMDETNTFVDKLAMMMKSDDPMYAGHNGWVYKKYTRASEDAEYMQVKGSNLADAGNGCHGCHAKASNDSVFVALSEDDGTTDDGTTDDGTNNGNGNGAAQ